ncbi:pyruvate dehydrogenase E1 component alpha subunit [Sarotherodon galilaeus]
MKPAAEVCSQKQNITMKAVVLLALFVVATGGYECPMHSVPYQVSLRAGGHYCSGSLISSQWVLSAGQCATSWPKVCLGEHSFSVDEGTEECIYSEKTFLHPDFNIDTMDNSIVLFKLSRPATLNSYVKTVSLPSLCPVANEDCMQSGWGKTSSNGRQDALCTLNRPPVCRRANRERAYYPSNLQCRRQPIVDDAICRNLITTVPEVTENMVCAGSVHGDGNDCPADAGGPLVCNDELQGVVSVSVDCFNGNPTLYTRVCRYVSWISSIMSSN